jgi:hypothetical protein
MKKIKTNKFYWPKFDLFKRDSPLFIFGTEPDQSWFEARL